MAKIKIKVNTKECKWFLDLIEEELFSIYVDQVLKELWQSR